MSIHSGPLRSETDRGFLPGWYPDQTQPGLQRWYDGRKWTGATCRLPVSDAEQSAPGARAGGRKWTILGSLGVFMLVLGMLATGWSSPVVFWALIALGALCPHKTVRVGAFVAALGIFVGMLTL